MYLIQYFTKNISLLLKAQNISEGSPVGEPVNSLQVLQTEENGPVKDLTREQQKQLRSLEEIKESLSHDEGAEKTLGQMLEGLGKNLLKYRDHPEDEDKEYQEMVQLYDRWLTRYNKIKASVSQNGDDIEKLKSEFSSEFGKKVDERISDINPDGANKSVDSKIQVDPKSVTAEEAEHKSDEKLQEKIQNLNKELQQIPKLSQEQAIAIYNKYGYKTILTALNQAGESDVYIHTDELRGKYRDVLSLSDTRNLELGEKMKDISYDDFIKLTPQEKRIVYFTHEGITKDTIVEGAKATISFRYFGKENVALSDEIKASQIFPVEVKNITVNEIEYQRVGLKGEFFPVAGDTNQKLLLTDGDVVTFGSPRKHELIDTLNKKIDEALVKVPKQEQDIARELLEMGGSYTPQLGKTLKDLGSKNGQAIENTAANYNEYFGNPNSSSNSIDLSAVRDKSPAIAAILNMICRIAGMSVDGEISEQGKNYATGVGISPEDIEKYGDTGAQLAKWIQANNYPVFEGKKFYCGRNVGECLDRFGIRGLPQSGRNGADWARICASRPDQFKQINCTPKEAPAGAIISYQRNTGGSDAREESGHVEIAMGHNTGYYFGERANNPGGSNPNFAAGTYSIWMPIST